MTEAELAEWEGLAPRMEKSVSERPPLPERDRVLMLEAAAALPRLIAEVRRLNVIAPQNSNADEWRLFLEEHQDAPEYVAVQIAEAIDRAKARPPLKTTSEERAEIRTLAEAHSLLHWPALLRILDDLDRLISPDA